jgi:ABC-type multidrug transport system fused ATPase/permease subunit
MLLVTVVDVGFAVVTAYLSARVSMGFGRDVRKMVFSHVEGFSLHEFDIIGTPSLITRTTNDITQVQMFTMMLMRMIVMSPIMAIGGVIMAYQKDAITGHRPTWKMGTGKAHARTDFRGIGSGGDPFSLFGEGLRGEQQARAETARPIRNAERKALDRLGLDIGATPHQVKMRFKELVKQFHPDANGGDRSTEDRLVEVIQAYNYLKSAGFG